MDQILILAEGIAIGRPLILEEKSIDVSPLAIQSQDVEQEVQRYQEALTQTKTDLERIGSLKSNEQSQQVSSIMQAHLQILKDPLLTKEVEKKIRSSKTNAEFALQSIIEEWKSVFSVKKEPFFQERAKEIQGLTKRVLHKLTDQMGSILPQDAGPFILVAKEVTATDVLEADPRSIQGFISSVGESTSHATIIAKAKGLCFITCPNLDFKMVARTKVVIIDANLGGVYFDPDKDILDQYLKKQSNELKKMAYWKKSTKNITYKNQSVILSGAIEFYEELDVLNEVGATGIGLVRSEFLLNRGKSLLSYNGQQSLYQKIASHCAPNTCTFRSLDISYEEFAPLLNIPPPKNPALSYRGLRWLLENEEIFKSHIRAMVLASRFGSVRIMFPMVTDLNEFLEAKKMVQLVQKECMREGIPLPANLPIGTMIEVPSTAILCDQFAKHADFFCLGTSDLMQYTLAIDRSECVKRDLFCPVHPAVIRLIEQVTRVANEYQLPLTLCGAATYDPKYIALFLGLGIREFALSPISIPKIRAVIDHLDEKTVEEITKTALEISSGQEMVQYLDEQYGLLAEKMDENLDQFLIG